VRIHYRRPPNRLQIFEQRLVHDGDDVKVTLAEAVAYEPPLRIGGEVVLERGSDVVWFTFPGAWHDIGRFHLADGTFTGLYANVLTPPSLTGTEWDTTDLFLDVWIARDGSVLLLDEDELDEAMDNYRAALRVNSSYAGAYYNLGVILAKRGQLDDAIRHFRQALSIRPDFADAHESLGKALALQGKREEASRHYQEALRILRAGQATQGRR